MNSMYSLAPLDTMQILQSGDHHDHGHYIINHTIINADVSGQYFLQSGDHEPQTEITL